MQKFQNAFTMLELVFVIVVIGILSAVAIPKFAVTRNDALDVRGKSVLASVRNALATERQKRILKGDFTAITNLTSNSSKVFDGFNGDSAKPVIEYPPNTCGSGETGCWSGSGTSYTYKTAGSGTACTFTLSNNRLTGSCAAFD